MNNIVYNTWIQMCIVDNNGHVSFNHVPFGAPISINTDDYYKECSNLNEIVEFVIEKLKSKSHYNNILSKPCKEFKFVENVGYKSIDTSEFKEIVFKRNLMNTLNNMLSNVKVEICQDSYPKYLPEFHLKYDAKLNLREDNLWDVPGMVEVHIKLKLV